MRISLFFPVIGLIFVIGCRQGGLPTANAKNQLPKRYLVVSLFDEGDPFDRASETLVKRHQADHLHVAAELLGLLDELRTRNPDYVAFVVKPDVLDINLANRILKLSTEVDDDPFVDFAYGFITGRDADAAVKLVHAADARRGLPSISQFGVGSDQSPASMQQKGALPLRGAIIPATFYTSHGDTDETRDEEFIKKSIPQLARSPILLLASHGYPDGLVGGPKAADIQGRDFHGSVALNIACYTGVTKTWYEDDWATAKLRKREVSPETSFCLQMIDSGAAGYFAYLGPRPSGPTMIGDATLIASSGETMGEHFRQHCNSVILAHLMSGSDRVQIKEHVDGAKLDRNQTPRQIVMASSTGGVLIGDPAWQPFAELPDTNPTVTKVQREQGKLTAEVRIEVPTFHFYASEPLNYWNDRDLAFRLETIIEVDDQDVQQVRLIKNSLGDVPHCLVAAVEQHEGKRMLHMKAVFAHPGMEDLQRLMERGLAGTFVIETSPSTSEVQPQPLRTEVTE